MVVIMKNKQTDVLFISSIIVLRLFTACAPLFAVLGLEHAPCPLVLHRDSMMGV